MTVDERARQAADAIEDRYRAAQGAVDAAYGQIGDGARKGVARQPLLALALAGLTGYAVALAVRARR